KSSLLNLANIQQISIDLGKIEDISLLKKELDNYQNIDIVINNAGKLIHKPFLELDTQDFLEIYHTNVFGVASLLKIVIPKMRNGSHVVNISSMGGVQGSVKFSGLSAYSSSKGALITLTELLAEEYKESGISFNVLALGAVQTEMLAEAFPGYQAPTSALEMADYIYDFSINGSKLFNGKIIQVSSSTP
ncbi:MAG: SDR family NAD(P)-dependent oxidoreductase, partial [Flavobacterium sp.]